MIVKYTVVLHTCQKCYVCYLAILILDITVSIDADNISCSLIVTGSVTAVIYAQLFIKIAFECKVSVA